MLPSFFRCDNGGWRYLYLSQFCKYQGTKRSTALTWLLYRACLHHAFGALALANSRCGSISRITSKCKSSSISIYYQA
ncbi:hypothetical protein OH492_19585 [Vibrio chagasii]|nr:hypothetical protein [Vibrio chagasii]